MQTYCICFRFSLTNANTISATLAWIIWGRGKSHHFIMALLQPSKFLWSLRCIQSGVAHISVLPEMEMRRVQECKAIHVKRHHMPVKITSICRKRLIPHLSLKCHVRIKLQCHMTNGTISTLTLFLSIKTEARKILKCTWDKSRASEHFSVSAKSGYTLLIPPSPSVERNM